MATGVIFAHQEGRVVMRTLYLASLGLLVAAVSCVPSAPGGLDPKQVSHTMTVRATRAQVLSALNGAAAELGLSVADANAEAGFWRTENTRMRGTDFQAGLLGATGIEFQLAASLSDTSPDSLRVAISGSYELIGGDRYTEGRNPIERRNRAAWAYIDSLAAKTARRLLQ
jgi:hypothetical protein